MCTTLIGEYGNTWLKDVCGCVEAINFEVPVHNYPQIGKRGCLLDTTNVVVKISAVVYSKQSVKCHTTLITDSHWKTSFRITGWNCY